MTLQQAIEVLAREQSDVAGIADAADAVIARYGGDRAKRDAVERAKQQKATNVRLAEALGVALQLMLEKASAAQ